jgi:hypothetical protein
MFNRGKQAIKKFRATVQRIIKPHPASGEPEKAQIAVEGADQLYRELRVPNNLTDEKGNPVKLQAGSEVEVSIKSEDAVASS